jgi:hypothetical protein
MQKPQDLSVTVALVALTPIAASVYDFVYVAHATAGNVHNKLRQTVVTCRSSGCAQLDSGSGESWFEPRRGNLSCGAAWA